MGLPRQKAMLLLQATAVLLCKLLLVDVVCSSVCDWLIYLALGLWKLTSKSPKKSPYYARENSTDIEVIICGVSRTGSMSLWHAMDILGFPCLHGFHLLDPTYCKRFTKAMKTGSYQDWQHLLHDYRAIADFPAAVAYKRLMELYPNAKVILNIRNPESWYSSFSKTLLSLSNDFEFQLIKPYVLRCYNKFFYQAILKGTPKDKELSIQNFKQHMEEVKKHVPPHKLYIFELEKNQGWNELCSFLEVPLPSVPFPFANDRDFFIKQRSWKFNFVLRTIIVSYLALLLYIVLYLFTNGYAPQRM